MKVFVECRTDNADPPNPNSKDKLIKNRNSRKKDSGKKTVPLP